MFARVTRYQIKSGSIQEAKQIVESVKPKIMGLPGMIQFINSVNPDGSGCVVALNESKQLSDGNDAAAQAIWAIFKDHLVTPPQTEGYEVFAAWHK